MKKTMRSLGLITLILILNACGIEQVDTGYRGIKTRFGEVIGEPLPEGLYFYNPFTSGITEYKVREETWQDSTPIFTKDTQQVVVSFAVTFYPDPKAVTRIFKEIGGLHDLVEKIIQPVVLGSIKDSIGEVIADDLVGKREVVTKAALAEVKENLKARSVIVTDLQLTNLDFDDAYEKAVEEKVVAIQKAHKAKNETVTIEEQSKQMVIDAKAKAESMKIQSQALAQNKGLIEYEAVKRWKGDVPTIMGSGVVPFIDFSKFGRAQKKEAAE